LSKNHNFLLYTNEDGEVKVDVSSETKISLLFDGFFFRYFSLQKSLGKRKKITSSFGADYFLPLP